MRHGVDTFLRKSIEIELHVGIIEKALGALRAPVFVPKKVKQVIGGAPPL
jgi:hypothetical protein